MVLAYICLHLDCTISTKQHHYVFSLLCVFLTNLADKLSELVQVALSIRSDAQLPDATVKLLRSLKWILQQKHGQLQLNDS